MTLPKVPDNEKLSRIISIRVTEKEYKNYKKYKGNRDLIVKWVRLALNSIWVYCAHNMFIVFILKYNNTYDVIII